MPANMGVPLRRALETGQARGSRASMQPTIVNTHLMIPEYREKCQFQGKRKIVKEPKIASVMSRICRPYFGARLVFCSGAACCARLLQVVCGPSHKAAPELVDSAVAKRIGSRARMPGPLGGSGCGRKHMRNECRRTCRFAGKGLASAVVTLGLMGTPSFAQRAVLRDPAEPAKGRPVPKILARPAGRVLRTAVDEKSMRALIGKLVACGTRLTLSSWTDEKRGIGCGRDAIVARLNEIAKDSGGKLQVVVDKFESTSERTSGKPIPLENVYAILPGSDPKLAKTIFIVSGHFDSRPSNVMDTEAEAPGADDDASGVAVSVQCARLLSKAGAKGGGSYRATILFAAVSGEEQGLLGSTHLLEWAKQQGYTIGGMLDDDIWDADSAAGAPHRVRLFSGNGEIDDADSPSRELARAVEEIDGRGAIRMIFRVDRYGRGGDHYPFYKAGLPAVRFTEPPEDYNHQQQTPSTANGIDEGDYAV